MAKISKRIILIVLVFMVGLGSVPAQDTGPRLSEKEIKVKPVRFINRAARMARSPRAVRRSQYARGRAAANALSKTGKADVLGFTFERVFIPNQEGFGADIMRIKPRTNYGHIAHIHRVLVGYLQGSFEYNAKDADLLARFLLYYNARLRGDQEQLKQKYNPAVVGKVKPTTFGIDRSYRNWAGRTEILLPLRTSTTRPGKTDVDPNEVRKEAGKVTPKEAKDIKDLVKRRRDEDKKALDDKQKELERKKQELEKRKEEVGKKSDQLEKRIAEMRKDPKRNAKELKKAEEVSKQLKKEEAKVTKQAEEVKKEEAQVKKEQAEIKKQEEQDKKEEKKASEPTKEEPKLTKEEEKKKLVEEIKKEVKKQQEEKSDTVVGTRILFLRVLRYFNGGHYNNELWFIDAAKDDAVFRGPFTQICGRSFLVIPGTGVLVIGYGGEAHTDTEHKLILLDEKTLDVKKGSKEYIFWRSPMIYQDDKIYGIEIFQDRHYLTRFNKDLTLDARSSEPVSADSDVTFYQDKIYLTGKAQSGQATTIHVLKRSDLTQLKAITPGN